VNEPAAVPEAKVGDRVLGGKGRAIGRVDAVFADYLLVRTIGLLPVDLYVPRDATTRDDRALRVELDRRAAYQAWHRPLKRVDHDD
jgi:hypothetical protein